METSPVVERRDVERRRFVQAMAWLACWGPSFGRNIKGRVVQVGNPDYDEARRLFNPRLDVKPRVIVYCQDVEDVRTSVQWANEQGWPLTVRSGGHHYEGFCVGPGLTVDVSRLTSMDRSGNTLRLGSGWKLGPLSEGLAQEKLAFPGGSCPTVGLAGYTFGGGYGLLSRALGLGCDNLFAAELVDAHGNLLHTKDHPDLLWALKGAGGGNFGVVTSLELRAHPLEQVTLFRTQWPWSLAEKVARAWLDWAPNADPRLSSAFSLNGDRARCTGIFTGPSQELKLPLWVEPDESWAKSCTVLQALQFIGGDPRRVSPPHKVFSRMLVEPIRDWKPILKVLEGKLLKLQLDSLGGRINEIEPTATAFWHRRNLAVLQGIAYWNQDAAPALGALERLRQAVPMTPHAYQNYPERELPLQAYYGGNLPRLREIRRRYDPQERFQFPQAL